MPVVGRGCLCGFLCVSLLSYRNAILLINYVLRTDNCQVDQYRSIVAQDILGFNGLYDVTLGSLQFIPVFS